MTVFHKSCGCVVYKLSESNKRQYLLLHYPNGHWDFVKGHVEKSDKDEIHTALRELKEETGLVATDVVPGFITEINYDYTHDGELQKKNVIFFLTEVDSDQISLSHEHQDSLWLEFSDAIQKLTFDNAKDVLIAAESFLSLKE